MNAIKTPADYAENGALGLPAHLRPEGDQVVLDQCRLHPKADQQRDDEWRRRGSRRDHQPAQRLCYRHRPGEGRLHDLLILLITIMAPHEALIYPLYYMLRSVGLFDNLYALIVISPC